MAATSAALRGLVASTWGILRYRSPASWSERLPIPIGWNLPDAIREDAQNDYETIRKRIRDDDWGGLYDVTPWQWMLALLGILDCIAPQLLDASQDDSLHKIYEQLRQWLSVAPEDITARQWAWPYDGMPAYDAGAWRSLRKELLNTVMRVDQHLGLLVRQVEAPVFRRHRDNSVFTDAESQQWTLVKIQYTGLGSPDNVARVQRGGRRLATWSEVRRRDDGELLSIHTLDDKLGRWWLGQCDGTSQSVSPREMTDSPNFKPLTRGDVSNASAADSLDSRTQQAEVKDPHTPNFDADIIRRAVRESQLASWQDRRASKSPSHMRVALLQWSIDESYSHPLAEVGLRGMGIPDWAHANLQDALSADNVMSKADSAATRGNEHTWPVGEEEKVASWPEHRRQSLLRRALEACHLLGVDLLVLPEVSVRRETVNWLEDELRRQYPSLAVLAGTYRHFGKSIDDLSGEGVAGESIHPLMAPLTLLWRPDDELSKALFVDSEKPPKTLRFWRGKKYRAVAAKELFRPDWKTLQPLFRLDPLLDQLGELDIPRNRLGAFLRAIAERMPPLRYCMELICSELFLLTSPANYRPLGQEVTAMLKRFPGTSTVTPEDIVLNDHKAVGEALSVLQKNLMPRRTVLLVPAATKRSNDYWHAGQASVLASGTATVFCNAAKSSIACGGSCFIGIDSATRPHGDSAGLIETLTPYHGWRKGILTSQGDGALCDSDQALVVVDIDPVHVVSGKPRPQLLPEPIALVAYLPVVELLDPDTNKVSVYEALTKDHPSLFDGAASTDEVLEALAQIATKPRPLKTTELLWELFGKLWSAGRLDELDLDKFARLFPDHKAVSERLRTWERDRYQQPHAAHGPLNLEPAWLDFLDVDLTLRDGKSIPGIAVPPWRDE